MSFTLHKNQDINRKSILKNLVDIQYEREEINFKRGTFRVRGDVTEVFPSYEEFAYRIELDESKIIKISSIDPLLGKTLDSFDKILIYPRTFFSTPPDILDYAIRSVEKELEERIAFFNKKGKFIEANRIEERTLYDLEMLREFGYCPGMTTWNRTIG